MILFRDLDDSSTLRIRHRDKLFEKEFVLEVPGSKFIAGLMVNEW